MAASKGTRRPHAFVEDTAVPPERLGDYVARFKAILDSHGLTAGWYGHCSVGCLHVRPYVDLRDPEQVATMRAVAEGARPGHGVRRGQLERARRRPRPVGVQPQGLRRRPLRGDAEGQAPVRPDGRLNPGVMVDAPAMIESLRDRVPARPALATHLSFDEYGGFRGGGRPLRAHRPLPQDGPGRDVPLVHGHARGGARHARACERAREGPLLGRPEGRPGRRAPARDPRPVPRVQGVQERVPAVGGHGLDEERVPLPLPRDPRHPAALPDLRLDPRAQPDGRRHRSALEPARADRPAARPARLPVGHRPPAPPPRFARETLIRWHARRPAPEGEATGARRPGVPGRLLHHLHRAWNRARGDRAARARGLARAAGGRLLRPGQHLQGAARRRARQGGRARDPVGPGGRARRAHRGLRALVHPHARRGAPVAAQGRRAGKAVAARRASWTRSYSRRSTTAGCASIRARRGGRRIVFHGHCHQKALAGTASTVELLRRIPGSRSWSSTRAAAAWPAPSASRPSTTTSL